MVGLAVAVAARSEERIQIFNAKLGKVVLMERVVKGDEEWKRLLTPEQDRGTRRWVPWGTRPRGRARCVFAMLSVPPDSGASMPP